MTAEQFNSLYPVGTVMIHQPSPFLRGGRAVKVTAAARDFKCSCIVEINVEPYWVKAETLKVS